MFKCFTLNIDIVAQLSAVYDSPVFVYSGVSDGQRHHSHAVHVVRHTLWFLNIPVHPASPWDPLQLTSPRTHKSPETKGRGGKNLMIHYIMSVCMHFMCSFCLLCLSSIKCVFKVVFIWTKQNI